MGEIQNQKLGWLVLHCGLGCTTLFSLTGSTSVLSWGLGYLMPFDCRWCSLALCLVSACSFRPTRWFLCLRCGEVLLLTWLCSRGSRGDVAVCGYDAGCVFIMTWFRDAPGEVGLLSLFAPHLTCCELLSLWASLPGVSLGVANLPVLSFFSLFLLLLVLASAWALALRKFFFLLRCASSASPPPTPALDVACWNIVQVGLGPQQTFQKNNGGWCVLVFKKRSWLVYSEPKFMSLQIACFWFIHVNFYYWAKPILPILVISIHDILFIFARRIPQIMFCALVFFFV